MAIRHYSELLYGFASVFGSWLFGILPDWVRVVFDVLLGVNSVPLDPRVLTTVVLIALWVYIVTFLTYVAMRRVVRRWDLRDYRSLTHCEPTVRWTTNDASARDESA